MAPTAVSSAASSRRPLSAPVWVCSLRDATEAWVGVGQRERNLHELCGCERRRLAALPHWARGSLAVELALDSPYAGVRPSWSPHAMCVRRRRVRDRAGEERVCGCYVLMGGARVHVRAVSTTFSTTATAASSSSSSSSTSVLRGLFGVRLRVSRPRTRACRTTTAA